MQKAKMSDITRRKMNIMFGTEELSWISSSITPIDLIDRILKTLYKLQSDCQKHKTFYLTKSSSRNLQIALAFSFSKSQNKNSGKVKDLMSILSQGRESFSSKQIIPIINGLIEFLQQGKENYDWEEAQYLIKYMAPLFFEENK